MEMVRYSAAAPLIPWPLFSQTVAEMAPARNFFSGKFPLPVFPLCACGASCGVFGFYFKPLAIIQAARGNLVSSCSKHYTRTHLNILTEPDQLTSGTKKSFVNGTFKLIFIHFNQSVYML